MTFDEFFKDNEPLFEDECLTHEGFYQAFRLTWQAAQEEQREADAEIIRRCAMEIEAMTDFDVSTSLQSALCSIEETLCFIRSATTSE